MAGRVAGAVLAFTTAVACYRARVDSDDHPAVDAGLDMAGFDAGGDGGPSDLGPGDLAVDMRIDGFGSCLAPPPAACPGDYHSAGDPLPIGSVRPSTPISRVLGGWAWLSTVGGDPRIALVDETARELRTITLTGVPRAGDGTPYVPLDLSRHRSGAWLVVFQRPDGPTRVAGLWDEAGEALLEPVELEGVGRLPIGVTDAGFSLLAGSGPGTECRAPIQPLQVDLDLRVTRGEPLEIDRNTRQGAVWNGCGWLGWSDSCEDFGADGRPATWAIGVGGFRRGPLPLISADVPSPMTLTSLAVFPHGPALRLSIVPPGALSVAEVDTETGRQLAELAPLLPGDETISGFAVAREGSEHYGAVYLREDPGFPSRETVLLRFQADGTVRQRISLSGSPGGLPRFIDWIDNMYVAAHWTDSDGLALEWFTCSD